ncbi:ribosome maturation factor RimM [Sphaerospermopsis aphanizomenoides BCCUSP55]|uniref:ribosome maturation factor RimM n=1 Tax=Sphaerospermopsis aphanizomenoides TaxID=459663 RepID=UPI001905C975|nr:ribosome maturation factor RimM [Sphaerospermopsis aphanizomenoides]MBK1988412.1 ribosome maturation factor RimM [Sphaerospermopsis aphanizomenoides BCCUSP55]
MNHEDTKNTKKKQEKRRKGKGERSIKSSPVPSPQSPVPNLDDWLEIGKIVAPQGLNGELRVYQNTDFPERFEEAGTRWLLRPGEMAPQPIELLNGRYLEGKNLYVIKLKGVSDRTAAENMRDCRLFVPISDRPQLEEGEFHVIDLIGLPVFMQESGELIGTVVDLLPSGHDLLEVKFDANFAEDKAGKTVLIPFVMEIVPVVDLENRRVEITPPPGLLSIND